MNDDNSVTTSSPLDNISEGEKTRLINAYREQHYEKAEAVSLRKLLSGVRRLFSRR